METRKPEPPLVARTGVARVRPSPKVATARNAWAPAGMLVHVKV